MGGLEEPVVLLIRNDTNDEIVFIFDEEDIVLPPHNIATFENKDFHKLKLENVVVKIKHNVIKIKGVV